MGHLMRKNAHSHGSSAAIPVAGKKKDLESQRFSLDIMGRDLLTVKANIDTVSERKDRDREIVR